jgi:cellulose synthase/poly-beta-1,6-N-acetylglucosamine synthase-like glycosyltransferase
MLVLAVIFATAPLIIALYAYVGYPLIVWIIATLRPRRSTAQENGRWPSVTITVPVYNALASIGATLESILALEYPRDQLQILVVSDASTDGTDDAVESFADRGVELLRLSERRGKTVAENAALAASRGEILVNVDSTILLAAGSLKKLVRVFDDPTIGVASGRDVSVGAAGNQGTLAESGYVGYEMWVRDLETRVGSIVGASGCFYGCRRYVHAKPLPPGLSWDFAAALVARKQGYRSVSVPDAICLVPRSAQIRTELRRKVRTMARGLSTLFYHRALMNPLQYGGFALMLISHKLLRWLPYLFAPIAYVALCLLAIESIGARVALGVLSTGILAGVIGIRQRHSTPAKPIALAGFVVAVFSAGFLAWWEALRQSQMATWEPTTRPDMQNGSVGLAG